jgi:hypothetical protein
MAAITSGSEKNAIPTDQATIVTIKQTAAANGAYTPIHW